KMLDLSEVTPEGGLAHRLKKLGLGAEDFAFVVQGHVHADHACGCLNRRGHRSSCTRMSTGTRSRSRRPDERMCARTGISCSTGGRPLFTVTRICPRTYDC